MMPTIRATHHAATGIGLAIAAFAMPHTAIAQDNGTASMSAEEVQSLPPQMRSAPIQSETTETSVGPDGVETVIRTRRIERRTPAPTGYDQRYANSAYAASTTVFERDHWIEECERRTQGYDENEKGAIIGGLLGAVAGGVIGNRVAGRGDRLAGTLIGAGTGGVGGALLGNLIDGGKKGGRYDCGAALDGYLSQHGQPPMRTAYRQLPPQAYPPYASQGYGYAPAYSSYHYAPPQQVVYVPIRYEQQQRVVVRETVREEMYEVPGAARIIDQRAPAPSPKMIKQ